MNLDGFLRLLSISKVLRFIVIDFVMFTLVHQSFRNFKHSYYMNGMNVNTTESLEIVLLIIHKEYCVPI